MKDTNSTKACNKQCETCGMCRDENQDRIVGAQRDLTKAIGFAEINPALVKGPGVTSDAWEDLIEVSRRMPSDPNMDLPNYLRSFGQVLYVRGELIPVPGVMLSTSSGNALVSGFNIGSDNPQNPGDRVFQQISAEILSNPAFKAMLLLARELDPCDPRSKEVMLLQAFVQAAIVDEQHPTIQAAPPDLPHNDACRFKANFLIGRHNVVGGSTYFLPRSYANKPFDAEAKDAVLKTVMLTTPGQGYCFLDDEPHRDDGRVANCHYAERISLGKECNVGYRIVTTITPTPLLPCGGTKAEIDAAYRNFASNTTALLDLPRMVRNLPAQKADEIVRVLTNA